LEQHPTLHPLLKQQLRKSTLTMQGTSLLQGNAKRESEQKHWFMPSQQVVGYLQVTAPLVQMQQSPSASAALH
jgi:hypothetical protein